MTPQIKQRIEQINNGIVPDGYKKTEFGIFPCDWVTDKTFGDYVSLKNKKYDPTISLENPICYELEHINSNVGNVNGNAFGKEQDSIKNIFDIGDVLFGKLRPYLAKFFFAKHAGVCSTEIWVLNSKANLNNKFLYCTVASKSFIDIANQSSFGTKMPRANWTYVSNSKIAVPKSTKEQEKIAEILMKWDEAIELQEKYIEKLKEKKKVLISKLLTPKADWKQTKLGKIAEMYAGGTPSTQIPEYWNGNIPWIQSGLIQNNRISISDIDKTITEKGLDNSSATWIKANSVLVAITGATCGNIAYLDCNATANQSVISISTDLVNTLFIYYYLQNAKNQLLSLQNGSAQGGLTLKYLKNFSISYPKENKEQQKIANLLKFVDDDIIFETKKCEKFKKQRKALQQYLLNGIVRWF